MTIDERIEALTQSLELLSSLHTDLEKQTAARFAETAARFAETTAHIGKLTGLMEDLAHIAKDHQQRIERLEQQ